MKAFAYLLERFALFILLIGGLGLLLLVGWGVAWYVADGSIFPEYSDVGWI